MKQGIVELSEREVRPHLPDAWIDEDKAKVRFEIPLNRHFYRYEPRRKLEAIEADIQTLEYKLLDPLAEVTGGHRAAA